MLAVTILSADTTRDYAPPAAPLVLTYSGQGQLVAPYRCPWCDERDHRYQRPGIQRSACGLGFVNVILD